MKKLEIKFGQRFGSLYVVNEIQRKTKDRRFLFLCDCGKTTESDLSSVRTGNKKSCGCARAESLSRIAKKNKKYEDLEVVFSKTYKSWVSMKSRCKNKENKNYGGRGIAVCERWLKFENFLSDMGERPAGMTLDRINNDGCYELSNCRWATPEIQHNNKRTNVFIEFNGTKRTVTQWSKICGLGRFTIQQRLQRGWSVGRSLGYV